MDDRDERDEENTPDTPIVGALTHTEPGPEKVLIVSRENGSGEREISASAFPAFMERTEGAFVVRETQVVAPHHSDSF